MVNMFGMIVGATLIPLVYWFLRTNIFYVVECSSFKVEHK